MCPKERRKNEPGLVGGKRKEGQKCREVGLAGVLQGEKGKLERPASGMWWRVQLKGE